MSSALKPIESGGGGGWMTRKGGGAGLSRTRLSRTGLSRTGLCGSGGSWKWRRAPAVCGAADPVSDAAVAVAAAAAAGLPVAQLVIFRRRGTLSFVERCVQKQSTLSLLLV